MQIRNIFVLLACALLIGPACTKGGGGVTPPDPKLGFRTEPTATAGRDSVIFGVSLNMVADVTISVAPDDNSSANNTKSWHGITNANLVVKPVAYSRPYTATISASAAGEETVSRTVRFTSANRPDPCVDDSASLDRVDVTFVWRPAQPRVEQLGMVAAIVCSNSPRVYYNDSFVSIDGGHTYRWTLRNAPANATHAFQVAFYDTWEGKVTFMVPGSEMRFYLNNDSANEVTPSQQTSFNYRNTRCPTCWDAPMWTVRVEPSAVDGNYVLK